MEDGVREKFEFWSAERLFDFVEKIADDDCGLSHQQLVEEARVLLGRSYSPDEDPHCPSADAEEAHN